MIFVYFILGCIVLGLINYFVIIPLYEKEICKKIMKFIAIGGIIILTIYIGFIKEERTGKVLYNELTSKEKTELEIEKLKEQNKKYEEEISDLKIQLEELKSKHEYDEELIKLLQEQLKSHGIEPDEL